MYQWILFFLQMIGLVFLEFVFYSFFTAYDNSLKIVKSISSKKDSSYLKTFIEIIAIIFYPACLYAICKIGFSFTKSSILNTIIIFISIALLFLIAHIPCVSALLIKIEGTRSFSYQDVLLLYGMPLDAIHSSEHHSYINYENLNVINFVYEEGTYVFEINPKDESVLSFYYEDNDFSRTKYFIVKDGCPHWSSFLNNNPSLASHVSNSSNIDADVEKLISTLKEEKNIGY